MGIPPDEDIVAQGSKLTVAWARDASGRRHAKEFLESKDAPAKDRARLYHWFKVMADMGVINNVEAFKKEMGQIFGFKAFQVRVAAFRHLDTWYLTHGFIKKKDKWPPAELARAERIMREHMKGLGGTR
jgi:hypothetical protein